MGVFAAQVRRYANVRESPTVFCQTKAKVLQGMIKLLLRPVRIGCTMLFIENFLYINVYAF